jgi:hypothetical protein
MRVTMMIPGLPQSVVKQKPGSNFHAGLASPALEAFTKVAIQTLQDVTMTSPPGHPGP